MFWRNIHGIYHAPSGSGSMCYSLQNMENHGQGAIRGDAVTGPGWEILHEIHWNSSEFWQGCNMKSETCAHIDRIELASAMIGHDVLGSVGEWSAAKGVILRHVPHRNVPPGSLCLWQNSLHSPGANQTLSCGTHHCWLNTLTPGTSWNILEQELLICETRWNCETHSWPLWPLYYYDHLTQRNFAKMLLSKAGVPKKYQWVWTKTSDHPRKDRKHTHAQPNHLTHANVT